MCESIVNLGGATNGSNLTVVSSNNICEPALTILDRF